MLSPQPLLAAQSFVRLHHAMPVPQQLPQIPVLPGRHPDLRKVIFQHEFQNQLRVLPICLLLSHSSGSDFCRISDPQLEVQLREQSFKPARLSTGFHPHTHLLSRELAIKLFRFLAVLQSPFLQLPTLRIHKRNLLKARVVICSYNDHVRLLSPSPLVGFTTKVHSGIGADIVMESITLKTPNPGEQTAQTCAHGLFSTVVIMTQ
jgi:hypothetical protein